MAISIAVVGEANMSEFKKAQRELDALRKSAEKSGRAQQSTWDRAGKSIEKYDQKMTVAGLAVVAGLGLAARSAEEAAQANARLEQVFKSMGDESGQAAEEAKAQADELSRLIGVDDEVIKGAQAKLATFSAVSDEVARQNGIFERATAAAADLAATGFGSMESASVMLGKALQDPIKGITAMTRVGVTFTAGEKDQIKALVAKGQTLEAQRLILGAVEKQVGGVAEASATSSAKFQVALGEFSETVGTQVLPAFEGLLKGASSALDAFGELPEGVQSTAVGVTALGAAALIAAPRIVATTNALIAMKAATTAAGIATAAAAAPLVILSAGLVAAGASAYAAQSDINDLNEAFDPKNIKQWKKEIDDVRGRQEDLAAGFNNVGDVVEFIGYGLQGIFTGKNPFIEMDESASRATQSLQGYESALLDVAMQTGTTTEGVRVIAESVWDVNKSYIENKDAVLAATKAQYVGSVATASLSEAQATLDDKTATLNDRLDAYKQKLDGLDGGYINVQQATDNFQASIDGVTDSLDENGKTLDAGTEKGRANRSALRDLADKSRDLASATFEQTGSQAQANEKLKRGREELVRVAQKFGLSKTQAEAYADKLGLIPENLTTNVKANMGEARQAINEFVEWVDGQVVVIDAKVRTEDQEFGSRAAGGGYATGTTLVGERGPELVNLPRGSYVNDAAQTSRMLGTSSSAGPVTINIDARGSTDPGAVEAAGYRGAKRALAEVRQAQMQGVRR